MKLKVFFAVVLAAFALSSAQDSTAISGKLRIERAQNFRFGLQECGIIGISEGYFFDNNWKISGGAGWAGQFWPLGLSEGINYCLPFGKTNNKMVSLGAGFVQGLFGQEGRSNLFGWSASGTYSYVGKSLSGMYIGLAFFNYFSDANSNHYMLLIGWEMMKKTQFE